MTSTIASIRAKLSSDDIALLRSTYGLDIESPESLFAYSEFAAARARIKVIEERIARSRQCHFCFGTVHAVGPLARAPQGAQICRTCAAACFDALAEGAST